MDEWVEKVPIWEEGCEGELSVKAEMRKAQVQAREDGMRVAVLTVKQGQRVARLYEAIRQKEVMAVCQRVESRRGRELVVCVKEGGVWKPLAILWGTQDE